jgi:hypothetical protein
VYASNDASNTLGKYVPARTLFNTTFRNKHTKTKRRRSARLPKHGQHLFVWEDHFIEIDAPHWVVDINGSGHTRWRLLLSPSFFFEYFKVLLCKLQCKTLPVRHDRYGVHTFVPRPDYNALPNGSEIH